MHCILSDAFNFNMISKCRSISSEKLYGLLPSNLIFHIPFKPLTIPIEQDRQINFRDFTSNQEPISSFQSKQCGSTSVDADALRIQTVLKIHAHKTVGEMERYLSQCNLSLSEDLILNVLKRHRSDWKTAYMFFRWVCKSMDSNGVFLETAIYNEIINILCRMRRFDEALQVFDEMSSRKNLINHRTYSIVVSRYCAARKVDEAIEFFHKIEDFGLERDLVAFQTLLLSLCRYKHVEVAELFFRTNKSKFPDDIKTWNIILNGWCVLGSLPDAKRFWKDIVTSNCKPDKFTYGIFINSLSKSGKISTAKKLLEGMWEQGSNPDVTICNCVIDGLCFKKRIPEALQIFEEMKSRGCSPNVAAYNTLIKHLCKIQRMEKVHELLNEMEETGESCLPNSITYNHLLSNAKRPEDVDKILEKMRERGTELLVDTYNLILRLFMKWGDHERVKMIWSEMKKRGMGPDQRSYTIMVHGLYDYGRLKDALVYLDEMKSKDMMLEPRTKLLNWKMEDYEPVSKENNSKFYGSSLNARKTECFLHFVCSDLLCT